MSTLDSAIESSRSTFLYRYHPWRPVDARLRRALWLMTHVKLPVPRRDDQKMCLLRRYLFARLKCRTRPDHEKLFLKDKDLTLAFQLRDHAAPECRWELESRLLAGETSPAIASALGVPSGAIDWYEAAFYDVRSRLGCRAFIHHEVIGALKGGNGSSSTERMMKLTAYLGGAAALDCFLTGGLKSPIPRNANGATEWLSDLTRSLLQRKAAIALDSLEATDHKTAPELLRLFARSEQAQLRALKDAPQLTDQEERDKAFLESIPWMVGDDADILPENIRAYDAAAGELRSDELMRVSAGETLPNEAEIMNLKIPAPTRKRSVFEDKIP